MKTKKKKQELKTLKNIVYKKEKHHVCLNSEICNKFTHPQAECKKIKCRYYKLHSVDVAQDTVRHSLDWWY